MAETVRTRFTPAPRGFRFHNSFDLLPKSKLPKIGRLDLDSFTIIGLCGGMCFTALDYFHNNLPLPEVSDVSLIPPNLLRSLRRRQSDSVPAATLVKLIRWILKDDQYVARMTAFREVPRLKEMLDRDQPAVLILVRTRGLENPTFNHQVVATGYEYDPDSQDFTIFLYDPNYPGREPTLRLNFTNPNQGIHLVQSTGEPRRGFFVQDYTPKPTPSI